MRRAPRVWGSRSGPPSQAYQPCSPMIFSTFETQYGVLPGDVTVLYILALRADQLSGPALVDIDYEGVSGSGTVALVIPSGTLAGTSFAVSPLPSDPGLVLRKLREHPVPSAGQSSGSDKWALTALLGNVARLLWVLGGESQVLAATARDVKSQRHLLTARGGSLDHIGQALMVPRLLPSPYRLDFNWDTIALYHLDDPIAPVFDATLDYPGVNIGANPGLPGQFNLAYQITPKGGFVIPDAVAFMMIPP